MKMFSSKLLRTLGVTVLILVAVAVVAAAVVLKKNGDQGPPQQVERTTGLKLLGPDTVTIPEALITTLGIKTRLVQPARARSLEVVGQLVLPQDRLARVRLRFPGRVVRIGEVTDHAPAAEGRASVTRELRVGDILDQGQLLAVVYSTDLGQKKSDLVDRLTTLRSDERILGEYQKIPGAMPPRTLWQQQTQVQQDRIAVNTAESTLRVLDVSPEEITVLRREADRVHRAGGELRTQDQFDQWARVEIRAPSGWHGTVLEKNAAVGEYVDPSSSPPPLFQLADLSRMIVDAWVSEDALRVLDRLPRPMHWTVRLLSEPEGKPLESPDSDPRGPTFQILPIIEPNQRSPILRGVVQTPSQRRLAGMPVRATIPLEPPQEEVEIPASALVDEGGAPLAFVQDSANAHTFTLCRVPVSRRYEDMVCLRSRLSQADQAHQAEGGGQLTLLRAGQRVLTSGVLELRAEMQELQARSK